MLQSVNDAMFALPDDASAQACSVSAWCAVLCAAVAAMRLSPSAVVLPKAHIQELWRLDLDNACWITNQSLLAFAANPQLWKDNRPFLDVQLETIAEQLLIGHIQNPKLDVQPALRYIHFELRCCRQLMLTMKGHPPLPQFHVCLIEDFQLGE